MKCVLCTKTLFETRNYKQQPLPLDLKKAAYYKYITSPHCDRRSSYSLNSIHKRSVVISIIIKNKPKTRQQQQQNIVHCYSIHSGNQSQNKLIRITILFYKSTSREKEKWVLDALRLEHTIFSIFLSVTAHYKAVSTIGKTNAISIRYLQDHIIQGIRHVMVNNSLLHW